MWFCTSVGNFGTSMSSYATYLEGLTIWWTELWTDLDIDLILALLMCHCLMPSTLDTGSIEVIN